MFKNTLRRSAYITLPLPLTALVLAFTAVPVELRSLTRASLVGFFQMNLDVLDIIANILGYVPVELVFAGYGPRPAVALAAGISLLAEVSQFFSQGRDPSVIDVATNLVGAAIGVWIMARWSTNLSSVARLRVGPTSGSVAALLLLGYMGMGAHVAPLRAEDVLGRYIRTPRLMWMEVNPRGAQSAGRLEGEWTFENGSRDGVLDEAGNVSRGDLVNEPTMFPESMDGGHC
jgi:glycopeptide antibiotics resistance protein